MAFLLNFVWSQLFTTPVYPTQSYEGKTVIVTGSNVGLGLEAARHFARLGAEKVILAVRSVEKGEAAKSSIIASTSRPSSAVGVWQLDLSSYESVKQFAQRVQALPRLDAIVENAGIATPTFTMAEENESTITTNVVSTFLLALLILPKLRETATRFNTLPHLVIVSSEVHFFTTFSERNQDSIFDTLNAKETANMEDRYNLSKLLEVLAVREISSQTSSSSKPPVVINVLNPGLCHSALTRDLTGLRGYMIGAMKAVLARTTEVGSRTLVASVDAGEESHGQYMSDGIVSSPSPLVRSDDGAKAQKKVWAELSQKLENIQPGILRNI
ncbi:MAG: putative secondary metabolism biosynthetic enzyme [Sclerophora amabilis]|nr:MAG: putative secondary metabolism biosynthetic enzyme [Sclerophora amabilis]